MKIEGKTLAITGVGGFIGARLARRALERGMKVRGLDQSPRACERPDLAGCEVIAGDIVDPEAADAVCSGADFVVHAAAVVREHGPRALFQRVNVDGTAQMVKSARAKGARTFVQVSSVMVYGFHYPPLVTENGPLRGEDNPYCETKIEGERVAQELHEQGVFDVLVLRPGDVYGPGSQPWVVRPLDMMKAGLFVLPSGGRGIVNHVYVDNLLDALFLAVEKGASGPYTVTDGVETTCKEFFGRLAQAAGRTSSIPTLPATVLRTAFGAAEAMAKLVRLDPPAGRATVDYLMRPHAYSIEKARGDLGYVPGVDLDEGMRRVSAWLSDRPAKGS